MRKLVATLVLMALTALPGLAGMAGATLPAGSVGPLDDPPGTAIQPGMLVTDAQGDALCTGGFIFDGVGRNRGKVYLGLAAHCVEDRVGKPVHDAQGKRLGITAYSSWPYKAFDDDFAFVLVDRALWRRVNPAMAGHPELPRSAPNGKNISVGDLVRLSGWGFGADATQATRQERIGVLSSYDPAGAYGAATFAAPGDSGGPVVDSTTGAALGSVSNLCVPVPFDYGVNPPGCTVYGPSVANIVRLATARGFPVRLRVASAGTPH